LGSDLFWRYLFYGLWFIYHRLNGIANNKSWKRPFETSDVSIKLIINAINIGIGLDLRASKHYMV
jgi:hypothetical protein